jgi:hypothetical protein
MKKLILTTCLTALLSTANAQQLHFESGNQLLEQMNGSNIEKMYAMGYVVGAADAMNNAVFCLPKSATAGQVNDIIKNYLTNVPQDRHFSADSIIAKVFATAFPCARKNGV